MPPLAAALLAGGGCALSPFSSLPLRPFEALGTRRLSEGIDLDVEIVGVACSPP